MIFCYNFLNNGPTTTKWMVPEGAGWCWVLDSARREHVHKQDTSVSMSRKRIFLLPSTTKWMVLDGVRCWTLAQVLAGH